MKECRFYDGWCITHGPKMYLSALCTRAAQALQSALETALNERDAAHNAGEALQRRVEEAEREKAELAESRLAALEAANARLREALQNSTLLLKSLYGIEANCEGALDEQVRENKAALSPDAGRAEDFAVSVMEEYPAKDPATQVALDAARRRGQTLNAELTRLRAIAGAATENNIYPAHLREWAKANDWHLGYEGSLLSVWLRRVADALAAWREGRGGGENK